MLFTFIKTFISEGKKKELQVPEVQSWVVCYLDLILCLVLCIRILRTLERPFWLNKICSSSLIYFLLISWEQIFSYKLPTLIHILTLQLRGSLSHNETVLNNYHLPLTRNSFSSRVSYHFHHKYPLKRWLVTIFCAFYLFWSHWRSHLETWWFKLQIPKYVVLNLGSHYLFIYLSTYFNYHNVCI